MQEWLDKIIGRIGIDGLLHILVSALLMLVAQLFLPWWLAIAVVAVIGISKEVIWDYWLQRELVQPKDLICDAIGILIGCLALL